MLDTYASFICKDEGKYCTRWFTRAQMIIQWTYRCLNGLKKVGDSCAVTMNTVLDAHRTARTKSPVVDINSPPIFVMAKNLASVKALGPIDPSLSTGCLRVVFLWSRAKFCAISFPYVMSILDKNVLLRRV